MKKYIKYIAFMAIGLFGLSCEDTAIENVGLSGFSTDQAGGYVTISSGGTAAVEGDEVDVTLTMANSVDSDVTVQFSMTGSATFGTDYTVSSADGVTVTAGSGSGNIVFDIDTGGDDEISFTIDFAFDATDEAAEDVIITLTGATAANGTPIDLGDPTANPGGDAVSSVTIALTDPDLTVGFTGSKYTVKEGLEKQMLEIPFVFSGAGLPGGTVDVTYSLTAKHGATAGVDYNITTGSTPFTGLTGTESIEVEFLSDMVKDGDTLEFKLLTATASSGITIDLAEADSAIVYIVDNLASVSHASADLELTEAAAPVATTYLMDIVLSEAADADVTVNYSLSSSPTGVSLADGGSVLIASGETTGTAVISVDPSAFGGVNDVTTNLVIDGVVSGSDEVSVSETAADLTRSITIKGTPAPAP